MRQRRRGHHLALQFIRQLATDSDFAAELRKAIIAPAVDELVAVFEATADRREIVRDGSLFRRLARLILTDLAFSSLIDVQEGSQKAREELFRTVIRPALDFRDHDNHSPVLDQRSEPSQTVPCG